MQDIAIALPLVTIILLILFSNITTETTSSKINVNEAPRALTNEECDYLLSFPASNMVLIDQTEELPEVYYALLKCDLITELWEDTKILIELTDKGKSLVKVMRQSS